MLSSAADAGLVQGSRVAVGPNGEVHAVWSALETDPAIDTDHFRYRRSTDFGASFGPELTCANFVSNFGTGAPGFNRNRGITFPASPWTARADPAAPRCTCRGTRATTGSTTRSRPSAPASRRARSSNGTTATARRDARPVLRGTLATTAGVRDQGLFRDPARRGPARDRVRGLVHRHARVHAADVRAAPDGAADARLRRQDRLNGGDHHEHRVDVHGARERHVLPARRGGVVAQHGLPRAHGRRQRAVPSAAATSATCSCRGRTTACRGPRPCA